MPPTSRRQSRPQTKPAQIVGDLNAPYLSLKFDGMFPELIGIGELWTVEITSRYLAMTRKETIPNTEIAELFTAVFGPSNPDADLTSYPARLQWRSLVNFFAFRASQIEPTAEIVANEPLPLRQQRSTSA